MYGSLGVFTPSLHVHRESTNSLILSSYSALAKDVINWSTHAYVHQSVVQYDVSVCQEVTWRVCRLLLSSTAGVVIYGYPRSTHIPELAVSYVTMGYTYLPRLMSKKVQETLTYHRETEWGLYP